MPENLKAILGLIEQAKQWLSSKGTDQPAMSLAGPGSGGNAPHPTFFWPAEAPVCRSLRLAPIHPKKAPRIPENGR